jgi:hypothetical protein
MLRIARNNAHCTSRSHWPGGLSRRSAAARLLVRIPPWKWMSISCECCVLSGRGLCVGPITCPEEFYQVWCVWTWWWSLEEALALAHWGLSSHDKRKYTVRAKWAEGALGSIVSNNQHLRYVSAVLFLNMKTCQQSCSSIRKPAAAKNGESQRSSWSLLSFRNTSSHCVLLGLANRCIQ